MVRHGVPIHHALIAAAPLSPRGTFSYYANRTPNQGMLSMPHSDQVLIGDSKLMLQDVNCP